MEVATAKFIVARAQEAKLVTKTLSLRGAIPLSHTSVDLVLLPFNVATFRSCGIGYGRFHVHALGSRPRDDRIGAR
jgi:hypothetical protein